MDTLLKIFFYVVIGCLLLIANVWFVRSIIHSVEGEAVIISPFTISGQKDEGGQLGAALASMLRARLHHLQRELRRSQDALTGPHVVSDVGPQVTVRGASAPRFLTEPITIPTALFEPVDIKVAVGGVELGGVLSWLQRAIARPRTVAFTAAYDGKGVVITGSLDGFKDMRGESLWLVVSDATPTGIADAVANELIHRRLACNAEDRIGVLTSEEFMTLLSILFRAARLNEQAALGRSMKTEFATLLPEVQHLSAKVPQWSVLVYLTARIADGAGNNAAAVALYQRAESSAEGKGAATGPAERKVGESAREKVKELTVQLPQNFSQVIRRIVWLTASFETGSSSLEDAFGTLLGNFDGQGLSFGVAGWNFGEGTLQPLLQAFHRADPKKFGAIMGDGEASLLKAIQSDRKSGMAFALSVQGANNRINEPWRSRFKALGREEAFQIIQVEHLDRIVKKAITYADEYGLRSERGLALMFDIVFQNGGIPNVLKAQIERDFRRAEETASQPPDEVERMKIIATRRSEATNPRWVEDVRARKLTIAVGVGVVHGRQYVLEDWGITLRDFRTGKVIPVAGGESGASVDK